MNQDIMSYCQLYSAFTKKFHSWCPVPGFLCRVRPAEKLQRHLHGHYLLCLYWTASKDSGKISKFIMLGVNQDSFPKMISEFAESIIV